MPDADPLRTALADGGYDAALAAAQDAVAATGSGAAYNLLAMLLYIDDRFREAREAWETAFPKLRDEGELCAAARVAIELAGLHASAMGHEAAASGWAERARRLLARVGPCVEWGYLELATMACDRTDIEHLLASTERADTIAAEFGDSDLEAMALADGGLALVTMGRAQEGFAQLDAALAAVSAGEVGLVSAGICFCSMLTACDRIGDVRRAQEWADIVQARLADVDGRPKVLRTHCRVAYGSVLCASGRWPEAEAVLIDALGPDTAPTLAHRALTVAHLAGLRVQQGRVDEAADLLAPYEDRVTSCLPLARVHLERDEPDLASAVLRRGLKELVGDALRAAPLLATMVEVQLRRGDVDHARVAADELAALAREVDVPLVQADAALADGRVLAALGDLPAATDALRSAQVHLAGDEHPLQVGLVRLELAGVLAAAADQPGAVTEARAALACFERLSATRARDQAAALLRSLGDTGRARPQQAEALDELLTPREREVLDLVAQGLSNPEIADRLYISPKTAEHHVGRILNKLGVRSRAEAAALAVRIRATPATPAPSAATSAK